MAAKKKAKPKTRVRKRSVPERERLAHARHATDSTAPTRAEMAALLYAAEAAAERLAGDALLLRTAIEKNDPRLRMVAYDVTAHRVRAVARTIAGLGSATLKAQRIYLVDLIERVAAVLRGGSDETTASVPSVLLGGTLVHAYPAAYIRAQLAVEAPDLAEKATDDVLGAAIAACVGAGPGEPGSAKWSALSDMWFAISGERVAPGSLSAMQAIPTILGR